MTEQSVIRALLLVALVWQMAVYWSLFVRDWPGLAAFEVVEAAETTKAAPQIVQEAKAV